MGQEGPDASWNGFRAMTLRARSRRSPGRTRAATDAPEGKQKYPGGWRVVRAIDLLDESVDVSPVRHVAPPQAGLSPSWTRDEVRALSRRLHAALATAQAVLPGEDWQPADRSQGWRSMTVDDLGRAGMAELLPGIEQAARDPPARWRCDRLSDGRRQPGHRGRRHARIFLARTRRAASSWARMST